MSGLIVGGIAIPVASAAVARSRLDFFDRTRALDGTYRASVIGNPKRDWHFTTPPLTRADADWYENVLSASQALTCTGDIIGGTANLLTYSEQFDNAIWTVSGTTVTANAATAPNGTTTADKIKEDASVGQHAIYQTFTGGSTTYTLSVFVQAAERTKCVVAMNDNTGGFASTGVDLSNGTTFASGLAAGSWTSVTSSVTAYGTAGWYRVTVTGTRGAGTVTICELWTWTTVISYAGAAGSGFYAWGGQLEVSGSVGSYIQTTTANTASLASCFPEILDWTPVATPGSYRVVLQFALHES